MPTMYITPEIIATAFLVYTPDGGGHYDAAIPHHIGKNMHELNSCCRCGSNQKNSTSQSCKPSPIYSTRCSCFKRSQPCSSLCRCKNCENPYGQRPPIARAGKRERRMHELQKIAITSSHGFAQQREECISNGIWSRFESIEILSPTGQQIADVKDITKIFNDIVHYSTSSYSILSLPSNVVFRNKSISEVTAKKNFTALHTFQA